VSQSKRLAIRKSLTTTGTLPDDGATMLYRDQMIRKFAPDRADKRSPDFNLIEQLFAKLKHRCRC
jgi:transposase